MIGSPHLSEREVVNLDAGSDKVEVRARVLFLVVVRILFSSCLAKTIVVVFFLHVLCMFSACFCVTIVRIVRFSFSRAVVFGPGPGADVRTQDPKGYIDPKGYRSHIGSRLKTGAQAAAWMF